MHTKIETKQPKPRLLFVMVIRWLIIGENKLLNKGHMHFGCNTVNQQILAAIKFGVSQNKVIWRLLNLAFPAPVYAVYDRRIFWQRKHAIRQI